MPLIVAFFPLQLWGPTPLYRVRIADGELTHGLKQVNRRFNEDSQAFRGVPPTWWLMVARSVPSAPFFLI